MRGGAHRRRRRRRAYGADALTVAFCFGVAVGILISWGIAYALLRWAELLEHVAPGLGGPSG